MHVHEIGHEHLEENGTFGGSVTITASAPLTLRKSPDISNAIRVESEQSFRITTKHKPGDCQITTYSREEQ